VTSPCNGNRHSASAFSKAVSTLASIATSQCWYVIEHPQFAAKVDNSSVVGGFARQRRHCLLREKRKSYPKLSMEEWATSQCKLRLLQPGLKSDRWILLDLLSLQSLLHVNLGTFHHEALFHLQIIVLLLRSKRPEMTSEELPELSDCNVAISEQY
jgi:hypothetical protein